MLRCAAVSKTLRYREVIYYSDPYKMDSKLDIYSLKCDRKDIVDFIKEVEKYPCLYNKTSPEYGNKFHNRKAWTIIAKKANTTVPDCRDKWRKIRISFMRSLKQQQTDKPPMRPYYLSEELHFLTPFIKVGSKSNDNNQMSPSLKTQPMEFELATLTKQEISDDDISVNFEETEEAHHEINNVTFTENIIPNIMKNRVENGHVKRNGLQHSYGDDIENNPRKMFLLSILPDVESFTEQEMRTFRREVIDIVDNIINKRI